jgi:hypothetical protein
LSATTPTRVGRVRLPGLYDDTRPVGDELVIPADLSGVETADLQTLQEQAVDAFNGIYGDGTNLSDADFDTLRQLTEQIERLRAESQVRSDLDQQRAAEAEELAGRVNPPTAGEGDPEGAPEGGEIGDETDGPEPVPSTEVAPEAPAQPAGLAASNRPLRVNLAGRRRALPAAPATAASSRMREFVTAAPDAPGYANGQGMDWVDLGRAVDGRLRGFNEGQYEAARRSGRHVRQQFGVAAVRRPIPENLMIRTNDPAHVDEIMNRATDESRLPGGSLVAAGGWCAPSEVLYDLVELESRDGLFTVPEVGIARGGIQFTPGPNFASIYGSTGFTYSEAQDLTASYGGGTNEVQRVTITGTPTGGTFTLTYNGYVTAPIPYNATAAQVQAALAALPSVPAGAVLAGGGPLPGSFVTVTFQGFLAGVDVNQMTSNGAGLTGGTTPAVAVTTTTPGVVGTGDKPCYKIPCPTFQEERLNLTGLCLTAGLLQMRGYPEIIARTTRGALIGHDHRIASQVIAEIVAGSDAVTMTANQIGATAPILTAIELQVEHMRYTHRMARGTTLEAVFPFWVHGAIRSDLSRRLGIDLIDVPNSRIDAWFADRGISPQFVYNWQDITGTAASFIQWPTQVSFLLYPAGTWVKGISDIITLDTIYDSVNLGNNDFIALFTEEGWLVAKRGHDSRVVTVPICADGATHIGVDIGCAGA